MKRFSEVIKKGEALFNGIVMFLDCDEDRFKFRESFFEFLLSLEEMLETDSSKAL